MNKFKQNSTTKCIKKIKNVRFLYANLSKLNKLLIVDMRINSFQKKRNEIFFISNAICGSAVCNIFCVFFYVPFSECGFFEPYLNRRE